jgi:transposase-like protein
MRHAKKINCPACNTPRNREKYILEHLNRPYFICRECIQKQKQQGKERVRQAADNAGMTFYRVTPSSFEVYVRFGQTEVPQGFKPL